MWIQTTIFQTIRNEKKVESFISSRVSHLFGRHSEQYKYEFLATLLLFIIFLLSKVRRRTPLCALHFNWRLENVHVTFSPLICSLLDFTSRPLFLSLSPTLRLFFFPSTSTLSSPQLFPFANFHTMLRGQRDHPYQGKPIDQPTHQRHTHTCIHHIPDPEEGRRGYQRSPNTL